MPVEKPLDPLSPTDLFVQSSLLVAIMVPRTARGSLPLALDGTCSGNDHQRPALPRCFGSFNHAQSPTCKFRTVELFDGHAC